LIRRDAEEIRDAIQIPDREHAPRFFEDFTDPTLAFIAPLCQVFSILPPRAQERIDVLFDEKVGFHRL
jgi:hypothetical protein